MKKSPSLLLFILIILISTLFVYWPSLFLSFVQDDFYLLAHSSISLGENIGKFFLPQPDTIWYRPLSQYLFFYGMRIIFGLHPFPFHAVILLVHIGNSIMLYLILNKLFGRQFLSFAGGMVYALHPIQFLSLVWPSAFGFVLGPFFFLLTIYSCLLYTKKPSLKRRVVLFILYLISLFTTEVNLCLILIIPILLRIITKSWRHALYFLMAGFIPVVCVVYLRLIAYPVHIGGAYSLSINGIGSSLRYYTLRMIGIPYVHKHLQRIFTAGYIVFAGLLLFYFCFPLVKIVKTINPWVLFGMLLAGIGISPFLLMPDHLSSHYAVYCLIGLIIFAASLWNKILKKRNFNTIRIGIIFMALLLILSKSSFLIDWQTHWIIARAKLADHLLKQGIYTAPVGTEEYFALGANSTEDLFVPKLIK